MHVFNGLEISPLTIGFLGGTCRKAIDLFRSGRNRTLNLMVINQLGTSFPGEKTYRNPDQSFDQEEQKTSDSQTFEPFFLSTCILSVLLFFHTQKYAPL